MKKLTQIAFLFTCALAVSLVSADKDTGEQEYKDFENNMEKRSEQGHEYQRGKYRDDDDDGRKNKQKQKYQGKGDGRT